MIDILTLPPIFMSKLGTIMESPEGGSIDLRAHLQRGRPSEHPIIYHVDRPFLRDDIETAEGLIQIFDRGDGEKQKIIRQFVQGFAAVTYQHGWSVEDTDIVWLHYENYGLYVHDYRNL